MKERERSVKWLASPVLIGFIFQGEGRKMERNEIGEVKDSSKMVYRPTQNLLVVKRNGVILATEMARDREGIEEDGPVIDGWPGQLISWREQS